MSWDQHDYRGAHEKALKTTAAFFTHKIDILVLVGRQSMPYKGISERSANVRRTPSNRHRHECC